MLKPLDLVLVTLGVLAVLAVVMFINAVWG